MIQLGENGAMFSSLSGMADEIHKEAKQERSTQKRYKVYNMCFSWNHQHGGRPTKLVNVILWEVEEKVSCLLSYTPVYLLLF